MQTKLTLRLEEELIRKAKRFSKKSGKPVSRLVAEFFVTLDAPHLKRFLNSPRR